MEKEMIYKDNVIDLNDCIGGKHGTTFEQLIDNRNRHDFFVCNAYDTEKYALPNLLKVIKMILVYNNDHPEITYLPSVKLMHKTKDDDTYVLPCHAADGKPEFLIHAEPMVSFLFDRELYLSRMNILYKELLAAITDENIFSIEIDLIKKHDTELMSTIHYTEITYHFNDASSSLSRKSIDYGYQLGTMFFNDDFFRLLDRHFKAKFEESAANQKQ